MFRAKALRVVSASCAQRDEDDKARHAFDQGAESHAVCAGIGYLEQAFSASVGIRQVVEGDQATAVFLGFEYHVEASESVPVEGF